MRLGKSVALLLTSGASFAALPGASSGAAQKQGFLGVVVASEVIELTAKFEGRLQQVMVRLGDRVSKHGVIAVLDERLLRNELTMAQAALDTARAEKRKAEVGAAQTQERLQRRLALASDIVSKEEVGKAQFDERLATAQVEVAAALVSERLSKVAQLQDALTDATIRAPFEGRVAVRYLDPGARVSPGSPVVRLIRSGELQVRFAIPGDRAGEVRRGDRMTVLLDNVQGELPAVVEKIAPEVDLASGMVLAEARLELTAEAAEQLVVGVVARVKPLQVGNRR